MRLEYNQAQTYSEYFYFFDKGNVIVLGNAFQKKSDKIQKKEIEKAKVIMEEYFNEKK